jgi:hypothetical protein
MKGSLNDVNIQEKLLTVPFSHSQSMQISTKATSYEKIKVHAESEDIKRLLLTLRK